VKQLVVTSKVVHDFIEQPSVMIYKTYCPKCSFYDEGDETNSEDCVCRFSYGYPSLCEVGTVGFYKYNILESIRLSDEAMEKFNY
jgi:hypothetical protein